MLETTGLEDAQRFDLRELVSCVVERLRAGGQLGTAEVEVVLPEDPLAVVFPRRQLEQVLETLLVDAVDRPGRLQVGVKLPDTFGDFGPRLFVQATGPGLREDTPRLTVARAVVEALGGTMTVHGGARPGSTLTVELPEQTASW